MRTSTPFAKATQAFLLATTLFSTSLSSQAASLEPVWQVSGFNMPESVVYDREREQYYIANVNGNPMAQDGNGSLGLIKAGGKEAVLEWLTGFDSPKGLDLVGNKLYIADVNELVVVNVDTQQIIARYPAPNSKVLNGLAISEKGQVFVSDWAGNAIYTLSNGELVKWLDNNALQSPNGLYVRDGYLFVGAWGDEVQSDFSSLTTGRLKRISLRTKEIENLGQGIDWMNLDGLHSYNSEQWLATDFMKGEMLVLNSAGDITERLILEPSAADFYYNKEENLIVVPYLMGQKVVAYRLSE